MSEKVKIMIIDDDKGLIAIFKKILSIGEQFEVIGYSNPIKALNEKKIVEQDLVLLDLMMPEMSGLEVLREIKKEFPLKPVIMLTGQGSIETAVEAMTLGATTYVEKPIDPEVLIEHIYNVVNYEKKNKSFKDCIYESKDQEILIGRSKAIGDIRKNARIVSTSDSAVLLTGESGTGKEVIAELIFRNSNRKDKPFVKINCAALPETLFESELFGYSKGAFTGADKDKKGKIEIADGGTLFLDEIGELSLTLQTKLLRVLQQKEIERLGSEKTIKVDIRLICATNRDLEKAVAEGTFRDDLYYRINVISFEVPPLRERREDIDLLVKHFFEEYGQKTGKDILIPTKNIMNLLTNYDWPGNVRELRNVVERIFVFGQSKKHVEKEDLEKKIRESKVIYEEKESEKGFKTIREDFERSYLITMLENNDWNVTHTAEHIGISRRNLQRKMKNFDIVKPK
ncbi:MAG: sigma-54 dependent transcriptional regulator [Anaerovoracaceae bacterium]